MKMHNASFEPGLSRLAEESTKRRPELVPVCGMDGSIIMDHLVPELDNGMQKSRPAVSDGVLFERKLEPPTPKSGKRDLIINNSFS
jgi:hypothetical protein